MFFFSFQGSGWMAVYLHKVILQGTGQNQTEGVRALAHYT